MGRDLLRQTHTHTGTTYAHTYMPRVRAVSRLLTEECCGLSTNRHCIIVWDVCVYVCVCACVPPHLLSRENDECVRCLPACLPACREAVCCLRDRYCILRSRRVAGYPTGI
jgi:hypothetical protein